jgi:hypothetical protein
MANITEEHLHHLARRHHQTMSKYRELIEKGKVKAQKLLSRSFSTLEMSAGSFAGGLIEGKFRGKEFLNVPVNLLAGGALLVLGHMEIGGSAEWGNRLVNVGNGFVGSWAAAVGYSFGKRWADTGKMFGGGGRPFLDPYEAGWKPGALPIGADPYLSQGPDAAQMANIVERMQAAAVGY